MIFILFFFINLKALLTVERSSVFLYCARKIAALSKTIAWMPFNAYFVLSILFSLLYILT